MKLITFPLALLSMTAFAAKLTVPPIIVGDYIITKADSIVENQTINLSGNLIFTGNRSQIRYCQIKGTGKVVFWNLTGGISRENIFENSGGVQLHALRTPKFQAIGNRFIGQNNPEELFVVEPGHQWQFPDAAKYGYKYNPDARFNRGQNRLQLINRLNQDRQTIYSGGKGFRFDYGLTTPTYLSEFAKLNKWIAWGQDGVVHSVELLSNDSTGVWLSASGLSVGQVRIATYNPEAFIPGILVAKNWFSGPGMSSGFSGYGLSGAIVEDNFAAGFIDMGLDLEVGTGGIMRNNVCVSNQTYGQSKYWNQMEIVAPLGPHYLKGNYGIVNETIWFYPSNWIQSDKPTRKPTVVWETLNEKRL